MDTKKVLVTLPTHLAVEVRQGCIHRIGPRDEVRNPADPASDPVASKAMLQLEEYFRGERKAFDLPLDWEGMSPFQRKVLELVSAIPYGETLSYRWLAEQVSHPGASRAVGRANATNPIPFVIPCHRVIRADGSLGGYYFGLSCKQQLLEMESRNSYPSMEGRITAEEYDRSGSPRMLNPTR